MRNFVVCLATTSGLIAPAAVAVASLNTFRFEVSNAITPDQPSTTITLWAAFDPKWFAFHETRTEVLTEFDRGRLSDPFARLNNEGFSDPGVVSPDGNRVEGIYITQVYIPFSYYPEAGSPISLWRATWTTDDFTPRQVDLATESESFGVYHEDGGEFDMFGMDFAEGSGFITVVPAPACAPVLTCVAAALSRRRRGS